jgi:hypothetical protein
MGAGRPLKFEDHEALKQAINDYFTNTKKDEWTITGLAIHLETSRETLLNYQDREEFFDTIKRAKDMVEHSYEIDLKKKGHAGSIFALKNMNWTDRQEIKHELPSTFLNLDPLADAPSDNSTP